MEKKTVLVIEDNEDICALLIARIRRWGYEVKAAYDGVTGLAMAQAEHPDLILLDLQLPKLPGEEVCRQIKKDDETRDIPIIMETGKVSDVDKVIGKVIGADSYLRKPYTSQQLLDRIISLLGLPF